jgi:UDP-N-acetylmuramoyl-L-alanyl-D-glutamate--2,6-diaminopimelate ligase
VIARFSDLVEVLRPLGARAVPPRSDRASGAPDPEIHGVSLHTDDVRRGDVFLAVPGTKANGTDFLAEAARRGACAAVVPSPLPSFSLPQVVVPDPRAAVAEVAAAWFGHPSRSLLCAGVTGTNGKTTTALLLRSVLEASGRRTGFLGTIGYQLPSGTLPARHTTPDAVTLQGLLRRTVEEGCEACVMEVSSHALHQSRVRGVSFDLALFTNLSPEHLDYHGHLEAYREAKARLFDDLAPGAIAVLPAVDPASARMAQGTRARVVRYSLAADEVDVHGTPLRVDLEGARLAVRTPKGSFEVRSSLPGRHNLENLLAAAAAGYALGIPLDRVGAGLSALDAVPGRLERVDGGGPFAVFVDYAHTETALQRVLEHLAPFTSGRLIVVFGCGGERDRGKRAAMGAVASDLADVVFLTNDNPRSEDPQAILDAILEGMGERRAEARVEPDRRAAIGAAVAEARPGDVVLVAGKGHETVQIVGREARPFDDRAVAREALRGRD